jgi:CcmD family protein
LHGLLVVLLVIAVVLAGSAAGAIQNPQDEEFKPATQLGEQLPGAPFVFAAYAFCWIAVLGYVFLIWRRLGRVEREIAGVAAKLNRHA